MNDERVLIKDEIYEEEARERTKVAAQDSRLMFFLLFMIPLLDCLSVSFFKCHVMSCHVMDAAVLGTWFQ